MVYSKNFKSPHLNLHNLQINNDDQDHDEDHCDHNDVIQMGPYFKFCHQARAS